MATSARVGMTASLSASASAAWPSAAGAAGALLDQQFQRQLQLVQRRHGPVDDHRAGVGGVDREVGERLVEGLDVVAAGLRDPRQLGGRLGGQGRPVHGPHGRGRPLGLRGLDAVGGPLDGSLRTLQSILLDSIGTET